MSIVSRLAGSSCKFINLRTQCSLKCYVKPKNVSRLFCSSAKLSKNAVEATKVVKTKIKSQELRRLLSIAEPEKYRLTG